MKTFVRILPVIFCTLLMAAHLGRANMFILQILSLVLLFLLIWKTRISAISIQIILVIYGLEWIRSLISYVNIRIDNGQDWIRLAIILGVVALLNFAALLGFRSKSIKKRYHLK